MAAGRVEPARLLAWLGLLALGSAAAQEEDLTLPPRLDGTPFEARLAEPRSADEESLEEIVVVADNEWRLPDLGTAWRLRQEDAEVPTRIEARFLPLYDPEVAAEQRDDLLRMRSELHRVELIELFQIRFGGRSSP